MRNYFNSNYSALFLRLLSVIIISISISCLLFSLLPKLPSVQASLLINHDSIAHSSDTEHEMVVLDNGRLANRYYVIAEGNNKIDLLDKNDDNITNTMIAIRFDQHSLGKGADIAGEAQSDFVVTSPITRHKPSIISGYSEDTETVYASKVLSYQVTQRTLVITDSNCVIMELIVENTDQSINSLTNGRLLYKVDFDAGLQERGDKGFYDETRRLIYHTDYHGDTTGSAIGVALLTGELKGYGLATDNLSVYPSITSTIIKELEDPTATMALNQAEDKNLAGWLVMDIPTPLLSGEKETLAFGWCAAAIVDPDGREEEVETEVGEDLKKKFDSLFGLSVDKSVTPYPTVNAGEVLTYTIVVANQGRGDINGIAVSDTLPDQTTLIPDSIQVDLPNSGIKGTTLPDLLQEAVLQPSELLTITYAVMVDQTTEDGTFITNEAAVTSNQTPAPITSSVTSIVQAKPNLDMRKFATPTGPVMVGQLITFTIVVSNSGHGPAEALVITDNLPPSLRLKPGSISLDPPSAGIIDDNPPDVLARNVHIPPRQRVTATIAATVTNHGIDGVIVNTAYATASVSDTITIPVEDTPVPILSVTKQASGPQIAGIPFTYTITVTNSSPTEEATGVIIEDTLPIGAEYLSGGRLEGEKVIWDGITVPANGTQTVTFSVKSCQKSLNNKFYRVVDSDQGVTSNWGPSVPTDLNGPTFSSDFTFPAQIIEDETISFNSQTSTNGSNIVAWEWDFGYDGNTGDGQTVSHTFANPGNYEVTLIVTDACDYEDSVTHSISVESGGPPPPTAIYLPVVLKNPPRCNQNIYRDDFNNPDGWVTSNFPEANYSYIPSNSPNKYQIVHHANNPDRLAAMPIAPFGNFMNLELIETKVSWVDQKPNSWYGIMFGVTENSPGDRVEEAETIYRFNVRSAIDSNDVSEYRLQKFDFPNNPNNPWFPIQDWTPHTSIKSGNQSNIITITCEDKARLYVNGTQLWEDTNSVVSCAGRIGITSHSGGTSHFDYFLACGLTQVPISSNSNQSWPASGD